MGPTIDEDDLIVEDVSCSSAVWHFFSMFWKIFGAFTPPTEIWGGWAAFIVSLALIGIITTIVGEVATVLGCVINLKPSVAGITLVALGTSLPDTMASMTAARSSPTADSAIGNVTGSNSVNVFLGLGIPWVFGCAYWLNETGADYYVPPGNMTFSIIMFLACASICFLVLGLRRCFLGGELGGHKSTKNLSAAILIFLWIVYIFFVSLESYEVITIDIADIPDPPELF